MSSKDSPLFQDDFSNPKSGWDRASQGGNSTDYADGHYRITLAVPQQDIWANPYQAFDQDITVEVDAWLSANSVPAAYGVVCGYTDVNNFYAMLTGSNGVAEIARYEQGKRKTLYHAENPEVASAAPAHLVAECSTNQLSLWVNGSLVAQTEPTEFTYGDVGLIVSSFDQAGVEVNFDNFVVKAVTSFVEP